MGFYPPKAGLVPFERYLISFQLDVQKHTFILRNGISSRNELSEESGARNKKKSLTSAGLGDVLSMQCHNI